MTQTQPVNDPTQYEVPQSQVPPDLEDDPFAGPIDGKPIMSAPDTQQPSGLVSRTEASSASAQTPHNELVNLAASGDWDAQRELRSQLRVRHRTALDLHNRYPKNKALGQASWILYTLVQKYDAMRIGHPDWRDLSELIEHTVSKPIMCRLTKMDMSNHYAGIQGQNGEGRKRGITMMAFQSYGTIEAGPSCYILHLSGKSILLDAAQVHDIMRVAKPGTFQAVPYDTDAVLFGTQSTPNGFTLIFPAGMTFRDVNGQSYSFKADIRLSLPFLEGNWLYWATAAARGEQVQLNDSQQERLDLQVEALAECFQEVNNGVLMPLTEDQLTWVQQVYVRKLKGPEVYESGRTLAGLNDEILSDMSLFLPAYHKLQAAKEERRVNGLNRYRAEHPQRGTQRGAQGESRAPMFDGNAGSPDDIDPFAVASQQQEEEIDLFAV